MWAKYETRLLLHFSSRFSFNSICMFKIVTCIILHKNKLKIDITTAMRRGLACMLCLSLLLYTVVSSTYSKQLWAPTGCNSKNISNWVTKKKHQLNLCKETTFDLLSSLQRWNPGAATAHVDRLWSPASQGLGCIHPASPWDVRCW